MNCERNVYYSRDVEHGKSRSHYSSDRLVNRRLVFKGTKDKCRAFLKAKAIEFVLDKLDSSLTVSIELEPDRLTLIESTYDGRYLFDYQSYYMSKW